MNTIDQLEYILTNGIPHLELGVPQDGKFAFYAGGQCGIPMGEMGNSAVVKCQAVGNTVQETLQALAGQIKAFNSIRKDPSALQVVEGNGRIR